MDLKTPLYDRHLALHGKIVPFAGYLLPIQYSQVIAEHMAVRQAAGLFDVSHMGEVILSGPDALACLNHLLTNDFTSMTDGRVRYSPMCNFDGGIVDDLVVCRMSVNRYMLVINAANRHKDVDWMRANLIGDVQLEDISDSLAQLALQGPLSRRILAKLADENRIPRKYYTFAEDVDVDGVRCLVSQTGYTGEHGYELYCAPENAPKLWDSLLAAGAEDGLIPCGLGARDTLRLEAAMPLYGHEMNDSISPLETSLDFAVKMEKPDFIGKEALLQRGTPTITRVGLKATGRGIIREHQSVSAGGVKIGITTSGTHCPYLNGSYAMALIDKAFAAVGTNVEVEVRDRLVSAEIVQLPFYKKP